MLLLIKSIVQHSIRQFMLLYCDNVLNQLLRQVVNYVVAVKESYTKLSSGAGSTPPPAPAPAQSY